MIGTSSEKVGGVETVAEILNLVDRSTERSIMQGVESEDPDLVEEIRRRMFVFEDINHVNDKGIQSVLKEVENDELCLALKTASDALKNKILANMSSRAAESIREDMEFMGPVRISDVEAAQQRGDFLAGLDERAVGGRGGELQAQAVEVVPGFAVALPGEVKEVAHLAAVAADHEGEGEVAELGVAFASERVAVGDGSDLHRLIG